MDLTLRSSLNDLFSRYEASRLDAASPQVIAERKNAAFLAAFRESRDTVIQPVMEAIGRYLLSKGLDYEVVIEEDGFDSDGRETEAKIGLVVIMGPRAQGLHEYPGLTVICEKHSKLIRFQARKYWPSRGGTAAGAIALDDLTSKVVQDKILDVLSELLK